MNPWSVVIRNERTGATVCHEARIASTFLARLKGLLGQRTRAGGDAWFRDGRLSDGASGKGLAPEVPAPEVPAPGGQDQAGRDQAGRDQDGRAQEGSSGDGLFIRPSSAVHTIGMAFAIDVIALDRAGRVVALRPNLKPQRLAFFPIVSRAVLELPAGQIERAAVALGDRLFIDADGDTDIDADGVTDIGADGDANGEAQTAAQIATQTDAKTDAKFDAKTDARYLFFE